MSENELSVEKQLQSSVNAILVNCGNLLTSLYSNSTYKAIPNPPGQIQANIDEEIAKFQGILDSVDVNIQLSRTHYLRKLQQETAIKETKLELDKPMEKEEIQENTINDENSQIPVDDNDDILEHIVDPGNSPRLDDDLQDMGFDFSDLLSTEVNDFQHTMSTNGDTGHSGGLLGDSTGGLFGENFDFMMPEDSAGL